MAQKSCKVFLRTLINSFIICTLCVGICYCFQKYGAWGKIPYHHIAAKLMAEGLISNDSHSSFNLIVDAGNVGWHDMDSLDKSALISIYHSTNKFEVFPGIELYAGKCKYVYANYSSMFEHKHSFYFLEYQYDSNIPGRIKKSDKAGELCASDEYSLSYIEYPHGDADRNGSHFETNGILA